VETQHPWAETPEAAAKQKMCHAEVAAMHFLDRQLLYDCLIDFAELA